MPGVINVWPVSTKSPEAFYTQQVASLLPGLNLGQQGGGGAWYDDLVSGARVVQFLGGGTVTYPSTARGGVALLSTVAAGFAGIMAGAPSQFTGQVLNPKTEQWATIVRAKIGALTAAVTYFLGLHPTGFSDHTGVKILGTGAGTGTLQIVAGGATVVSTAFALDTTTFHDYMVTYDTVTMSLYVDSVFVLSTQNSANVITAASAVGAIASTGAAENDTIQIDRIFAAYGAP